MKIHKNDMYTYLIGLATLSSCGFIGLLVAGQKWYWISISLFFAIGLWIFSVIWIKNNYLILSENGVYSKTFRKENFYNWDDFISVHIIELNPMRGVKIKFQTNKNYLVIINQTQVLCDIKNVCSEKFWEIFKSEYYRFY